MQLWLCKKCAVGRGSVRDLSRGIIMKKSVWIAGAAALVLASGFLLVSAKEASAGTLPSGFIVGGFDLTGLTEEEANQKIEDYVASMSGQAITLTIDGNEITTTAADLGFAWSNQAEIEEAAARYAGGNLLRRYLNQKSLEEKPLDIGIETAVDAGRVAEFVDTRLSEYTRPAQDATITKTEAGFEVTESVVGMEVDKEATKQALDEAIQNGLTGPVTVAAVVTETQPTKTAEELETIQDVLGTFSTSFSAGNRSRTKNLTTGAGKINGTVLMPGEEFSAYTWLTPFTVENGYAAAGSYANGQVVDTVGGGACQICTTLYNAALLSELEITQRQNHSMIVTYVKPSCDSAIAGTVKDLKFKNSYETPIYLEGVVKGGTISFTIYGQETRPANREIKYVSETVGTKDPGEPIMKEDPTLAPGTRVKEQSAHTGMQSRLWKYVYVDGVETEKTLVSSDSYMASKAIYRVGPALPAVADPNAAVTDPNAAVTDPTAPADPNAAGQATSPTQNQPAGPAATGPGAESQNTASQTTSPTAPTAPVGADPAQAAQQQTTAPADPTQTAPVNPGQSTTVSDPAQDPGQQAVPGMGA